MPGFSRLRLLVKSPLTWLVLFWGLSRLFLIVFCVEGIQNNPEEAFIPGAGSHWRENFGVLALWQYQYSPYEGGSLWVNTITSFFQVLFGENLFAMKMTPWVFGLGALIVLYRLLEWMAGRAAAVIGSVFVCLPPSNILVEEMKNDGLHYDSTAFSLLGVLLLARLAEQAAPSWKRLVLTGGFLGLALSFSYQSSPFFAAALFAWLLSRSRRPAEEGGGTLGLLREGGLMAVALLTAFSYHFVVRVFLGANVVGLHEFAAQPGGMRAGIEELALRPISMIWTTPFQEADFKRVREFDGADLPLVAVVVLGAMVLLACLRWRDFLSCLTALRPDPASRADLRAAFGPPLLILFPLVYAVVVERMHPGLDLSWYYYPLYPLYCLLFGVLGAELWKRVREARSALRLSMLTLCAAGACFLLLGHARGTSVVTDMRSTPDSLKSRGSGYDNVRIFVVWNWIPYGESPHAVRDRLLELEDPVDRGQFLMRLGQSLKGDLPRDLASPLVGWDRVSFFAGHVQGKHEDILATPGIPNRWTPAQLGELVAEVPGDPCALIGREIGAGLTAFDWVNVGRRSDEQEALDEGTAWYWFGRGVSLGRKLSKDIVREEWFGHPGQLSAVDELVDHAGAHREMAARGIGWAIAQGGNLGRYRSLQDLLDKRDLEWVLEGFGAGRDGNGERVARDIAEVYFGPAGSAAVARGVEARIRQFRACSVEH